MMARDREVMAPIQLIPWAFSGHLSSEFKNVANAPRRGQLTSTNALRWGFRKSANDRPTGQDQSFILMIYDGSDNPLPINVSLLEPSL